MDLVIFEESKSLILAALQEGEFDYMESASEVFETDFFRFIKAKSILSKLAETYPTPRQKEEVPLLFYVASDLSMRLHGVHAFNAYPMVVQAGGMLNIFGPPGGRKVTHPDTGELTVYCEGFNNKNHYDRQSPCDPDYLRKMAKDTPADKLMSWFNTTCLNSADVSPGMETAPKSSFSMIKSRHGNPETSPLCLQMYVPYSLDPEIQVRGTSKGSG